MWSFKNLSACQMKVLTPVSVHAVEVAGFSEIPNISIALRGISSQKTLLFLVTALKISDSSYSSCTLCPYFIPYVTLFFTSDIYLICFGKKVGWGCWKLSSAVLKIQKVRH
jgi:hypothetical protein